MTWIRWMATALVVVSMVAGCGDDGSDIAENDADPVDVPGDGSGIDDDPSAGGEPLDAKTTERGNDTNGDGVDVNGSDVDGSDVNGSDVNGSDVNGSEMDIEDIDVLGTDWSTASAEEIRLLLFGSDHLSNSAFMEYINERTRLIEQIIADCMIEKGYEYTPYHFEDGSGFELGTREFAEKYGFMITTDGLIEDAMDNDPNQEYIRSLSDSEQSAYYDALYGEAIEIAPTIDENDPENMPSIPLVEPVGCVDQASDVPVELPNVERVFQGLAEEFAQFNEDIVSDQRTADLEAKWSDCMGEKGHSYTEFDELTDDIFSSLQEFEASLPDPFEGMSQSEIDELSDSEFETLLAETQPDEKQLAELREYETAVAVDSWDCGMFDAEVMEAVFDDHADKFVSDNLEEIRSLLVEK